MYIAPRAPGVGTAAKQGFGWAAGCLLFIVVIVVALAVVGSRSGGSLSPRATTPAAPHVQKSLLTLSGNGIQRSAKFATTGDWRIDWTYDCSNFGYKGNFIISVQGDTMDVATNELGTAGSGTTPEYTGPGTYYLEMNSECHWTVNVFG